MTLPRVDHLGMGGTIACRRVDDSPGAVPVLEAEDVSLTIPGIGEVADIRAEQFLRVSSSELTITDLLRLRDEAASRVAAGARGVIVTQGTDSIEETAYVLDLLWTHDAPLVLTGAMRHASLPGADGPANVLAAVQVAVSEAARGLGVLVVFNDEIHAARFVRKTHTTAPNTFASPAAGPLGWVTEGRPYIAVRPVGRPSGALSGALLGVVPTPPVALLHLALGDDGRLLGALGGLGYVGAVLESFGGGHVPPAMVSPIRALLDEMPVVLASRTGVGQVLTDTYRFAGSEIELLALGVIRAGSLDARKARLLLTLGLAAGYDRDALRGLFADAGLSS
jgi:L-asparaginase